MKKILMLGGGFLQNFVIVKAKQLGYKVLVLDADPNAMGFEHADSNIDQIFCLIVCGKYIF